MKNILISGVLLISTILTNAQAIKKPATNCELGVTINSNYSKSAALDSIMKHYTTNALPGAAIAVYSDSEGWWASA